MAIKKTSRTIYKINEKGVCKLLATFANHGFTETGHVEAVKHAKNVFFAVKGNEKRPITNEEASKLIRKGLE